MRWQEGRRSENVEDRRGMSPRTMAVGGGLGALVITILALLFNVNPNQFLQQQQVGNVAGGGGGAPVNASPEEEQLKEMMSVVLAETEDVWTKLFAEKGQAYQKPKLVLFRDQVKSACGMANAAVGPFYCPGDENVYLDLAFFEEMKQRFGASGDFAQAYVVAHEVGHHVQKLLGISDQVDALRGRLSERDFNQLSVRLELQADFLAGVWAHHAQKERQILEEGDIEEALNAATAIGDDRLQKQTQGYVVPDAFTHGTSKQRVTWFVKGLSSGRLDEGDTFNARDL